MLNYSRVYIVPKLILDRYPPSNTGKYIIFHGSNYAGYKDTLKQDPFHFLMRISAISELAPPPFSYHSCCGIPFHVSFVYHHT